MFKGAGELRELPLPSFPFPLGIQRISRQSQRQPLTGAGSKQVHGMAEFEKKDGKLFIDRKEVLIRLEIVHGLVLVCNREGSGTNKPD